MTSEVKSSRSVSVVLPASTCARIPRLSVFRDTRHILRIGPKGHLDGREHLAHLLSSTIGAYADANHRASGREALTVFPGTNPQPGRDRTFRYEAVLERPGTHAANKSRGLGH